MKYLKGPFSFILLLSFLSVTLYSQNFKIGFFSGDWARPGLDISNLPQRTGANIIIHQLTPTNFSQFNNFSYMIPQNVWSAAEKINHYTAGMKTKWEAEAPVSNGIGFEHECGTSGGSYWYSGINSSDIGKYLIKGPHYTQFKKYFLDYWDSVFVNYRLRIKIKRGTNVLPPIQGGSTSDLCKISVLTQGNVVQERTLTMNDITENFSEILVMTYNFSSYGSQAPYINTLGPANITMIKETVNNVEFRVKWLGNRDLYLDYINVNDVDIWENYNTTEIDNFLNIYSSLNQNRLAWYGFDEPEIDNYEPLNVVNQYLINGGNTPVLTTYMPWNGTIYTPQEFRGILLQHNLQR